METVLKSYKKYLPRPLHDIWPQVRSHSPVLILGMREGGMKWGGELFCLLDPSPTYYLEVVEKDVA